MPTEEEWDDARALEILNEDAQAHKLAVDIVDAIIAEADIGGVNHAPCFRDCLSDNREWVQKKIATLLAGR